MKKAIFYKEWIKLRYIWGVMLFISICFVIYTLLRIQRVISFKGVAHLWEILLQKEVIFIDILQYIPLLIGILIALAQFIPEMQQKRLKLTLHLPYSHKKMIFFMLGTGLGLISCIFILHYAILAGYLSAILAPELTYRILLTSFPWYLAGLASYMLTAWICLEPTWSMRIINILIAAATLRLFFLTETPQAYDPMLITLVITIICLTGFPYLSVVRFTAGKQDSIF